LTIGLYKKGMVLGIIFLFVGAGVISNINAKKLYNSNPEDELDQEQPFSDFYAGVPLECWRFAQSFTPSLNILTRVKLEMSGGAIVSIRDDLYGGDLTSVYAQKSSSHPFDWVEFDFEDISVIPGKTYYIIWNPGAASFAWGNKDYDMYDGGQAYEYNCETWVTFRGDFTFKTYGYNEDIPVIPDLNCSGNLNWNSLKPGVIVTGNFIVHNIGDSGSELNWKIESCPSWGIWTFAPISGENLKPEDGPIIVEVSVVSPDVKESNFTGSVMIVNMNDSSDYEIIPVSLTTPKNKSINISFLQFLENHPCLLLLLRQLLRLS